MSDVWSGITNVPVHLPHNPNMLITVQKRVLFVLYHATTAAMTGPVRFKTGIGENDNQPLCVFVGGRYGSVLFGHELGEFRWGAGLGCPCLTSTTSACSVGSEVDPFQSNRMVIRIAGGGSTFTLSLLWPCFWRHRTLISRLLQESRSSVSFAGEVAPGDVGGRGEGEGRKDFVG